MLSLRNVRRDALRASIGMVVFVLCVGALPAQKAAKPAAAAEGPAAESSVASRNFLHAVNTSPQEALQKMPGLTPDVVTRILDYRKGGKTFANLLQFRKLTRIPANNLEQALTPYMQQEEDLQVEAQRKPVEAPAQGKAGGRMRTPDKGTESEAPALPAPAAPQGKGPVGNVRPGFYAKLPGYENLDLLDPIKKKEFLEMVNHEMCTCGCSGETLAFCLVNDPACPVVKARVRKVYEDVTGHPPN